MDCLHFCSLIFNTFFFYLRTFVASLYHPSFPDGRLLSLTSSLTHSPGEGHHRGTRLLTPRQSKPRCSLGHARLPTFLYTFLKKTSVVANYWNTHLVLITHTCAWGCQLFSSPHNEISSMLLLVCFCYFFRMHLTLLILVLQGSCIKSFKLE